MLDLQKLKLRFLFSFSHAAIFLCERKLSKKKIKENRIKIFRQNNLLPNAKRI